MRVGDFVCFILNEFQGLQGDCGEWYWDHGLVLSYDTKLQIVDVMSGGEVFVVRAGVVQKIEDDHWHPGMPRTVTKH